MNLKTTFFLCCLLFFCQIQFIHAQSKKEQIEILIYQKDSLVKVLAKERQQNTDQVKQLETKISKVNSDMVLIQKELAQSKKELADSKRELAAKEEEIEGFRVDQVLRNDTIRSLREELHLIKASKNESLSNGLSKEEAETRMRMFLIENIQKYKDYGELEAINLLGGNYTKDVIQDYFYIVRSYGGGDFVSTSYFFYDSEYDKIRELTLNYDTKVSLSILNIEVINEGKIMGQVLLWDSFSGEHFSERILDVDFTIKGAIIIIDEKYHSQLKIAEKEVIEELAKIRKEIIGNLN